jgi:hypothetical protein
MPADWRTLLRDSGNSITPVPSPEVSLSSGAMENWSSMKRWGWHTKQCFGHAGVFSCLAFGDHQTNVSAAIFTNGNRGIGDVMKRFIPMSHGIRKACV